MIVTTVGFSKDAEREARSKGVVLRIMST